MSIKERFFGLSLWQQVVAAVIGTVVAAGIAAAATLIGWSRICGAVLWLYRSTEKVHSEIVTAAAVLAVVCAVLWVRRIVNDRRDHRPAIVVDAAYDATWRIQIDPAHWQQQDIRRFGDDYVQEIIAGPFHLTRGCQATIHYSETPQTHYTLLQSHCSHCDAHDFAHGPWISEAQLQGIRRAVLHELQRLYRQGMRLRGTVKLPRPVYGDPH